jgi:type VI secretion system protein ImpB
MARDSIQKKLSRVRPPRVHITYDVETLGAIEKKEIPFVAGVLADLSGHPDKPLPRIQDRNFVEVDRDNFDKFLNKTAPRLAFKVDNRLTDEDAQLPVELRFSSMEDFEPAKVAEQVEPLRKLLELRRKLSNLRSTLYGNERLDRLLQEVVHSTDVFDKLRTELGVSAPEDQGGPAGKKRKG